MSAGGLGLAGAGVPAIAADPWVVSTDAALALRDPDRFAWHMFVALTWPADPSSRLPASDRPYGDPGPVMFETWAMSDQVFLPKGAAPPAWDDIDWSDRTLSTASVPRQIAIFRDVAAVKSGSISDEQEEVRLNRPAFDYIRDNGLYSVEGQQWFFYNRQPIAFPLGAIAVQTVWRPIGEEDKARYQWQEFRDPKRKRPYLYGLTALHIQSKVLPHWFWATFEHVDNPYRPGLYDEGWLTRHATASPVRRASLRATGPRRLRPGRHALGELSPARYPDRLCRCRRQPDDPRQLGAGARLPAILVLHVVPCALHHRAQPQRPGELRLQRRQQGP